MHRRTFLGTAALLAGTRRLMAHEGWHTYEVTTRLAIRAAQGATQAWVPLPLAERTPYQKSLADTWTGNAASVEEWTDETFGARLMHARWPASETAPVLTVVSRVATQYHVVPLDEPTTAARGVDPMWRQPATLLPLDGIVRDRALAITAGRTTEIDKARAIYDWIVENTFRDPKVQGCGRGDIRAMLETGHLGGKCADLNALFVGLARAAGLAARDVYGLRVGPSITYQSLGKAGGDVTRAQHCRAEFHAPGFGWIPVDPADVRKVVLEEPPGPRTLEDPVVRRARQDLFGSWEMNWIAYNRARDLALPGSAAAPVPFLMYPQAEVGTERRDSLAPDTFTYEITSREVEA